MCARRVGRSAGEGSRCRLGRWWRISLRAGFTGRCAPEKEMGGRLACTSACVQRESTPTGLHFRTGTAGTDCRIRLQPAPMLGAGVPVSVLKRREQNGNKTGTAERGRRGDEEEEKRESILLLLFLFVLHLVHPSLASRTAPTRQGEGGGQNSGSIKRKPIVKSDFCARDFRGGGLFLAWPGARGRP